MWNQQEYIDIFPCDQVAERSSREIFVIFGAAGQSHLQLDLIIMGNYCLFPKLLLKLVDGLYANSPCAISLGAK